MPIRSTPLHCLQPMKSVATENIPTTPDTPSVNTLAETVSTVNIPTTGTFSFLKSSDLYEPTALLCSLLLVGVLFFLSYRKKQHLHYRLQHTEKELSSVRKELNNIQEELSTLLDGYQTAQRFQRNMKEAEQTIQLGQKITSQRYDKASPQPPEKYHYAQRLAQNGMLPEEIAATLAISSQEAAQVVALTRLAA